MAQVQSARNGASKDIISAYILYINCGICKYYSVVGRLIYKKWINSHIQSNIIILKQEKRLTKICL